MRARLTVALFGAGRMGREVAAAIAADGEAWRLGGLWVRDGHDLDGRPLAELAGSAAAARTAASDPAGALAGADVAIDFTLPGTTAAIAGAARSAGTPLVCGVTGLDAAALDALDEAAADIPVFYARNMSVGIALLTAALERAAAVLGRDAAAAISDLHHAGKRDAPSGTALALGEALAQARGQDFAAVRRYDPATGEGRRRGPADIVYSVRRAGTHPGRHAVTLAGRAETLEFVHEVTDRRVFADGALRAARWLAGQRPGRYRMADLLASPGGQ